MITQPDGSGPDRDHPAVALEGSNGTEQWTFNASDANGTLAVSVGVGRRRGRDRAADRGWYWLVVAGRDRTCVAVVDPDLALPATPSSLEYRSPGLWADHHCSEAFGHWSVAAEAFGVALVDPWELWGRGFGDPTAAGADLEWDPVGERVLVPHANAGGRSGTTAGHDPAGAWTVGCAVHGELLVGDQRYELDCDGVRGHQWGTGELWRPGWLDASWRTPSGSWIHHTAPDGAPAHDHTDALAPSSVTGPGGDCGSWTLPVDGCTSLSGQGVALEVISWAPVLDGAATSGGRLVLALAQFSGRDATGTDCGGVGWVRYRPRQPSSQG